MRILTDLSPSTSQVRHRFVDVRAHLELVVSGGRKGSNRDQAPVSRREAEPPAEIVEHHVVGQLDELRRDGSDASFSALARAASDVGAERRGPTVLNAEVSTFRAPDANG